MGATAKPLAKSESILGRVGFRRYWFSRILSQTAQAAVLYGLLVLVVDRTESGIWASLFVACSIIPSLLFGLVGGVVADWLPQRALMTLLNLGRAGIVSLLVVRDITLETIFLVTIGIWVVHQFYSPAESAVLPRLVAREQIASATSLHNLALSLAQLAGMVMIAPLLLKLGEPEVLFAVCAALYAAAAIALLLAGWLPRREPEPHETVGEEMRASLRTGWQVMVRGRESFAALVDSVLVGIGLSTLVVIVPQYLERVLDTAADNTVYVFAPAALGLIVGLQIAPLAGRLIGHRRLATLGLISFAAAVLAIGLVEPISGALEASGLLVGWLDEALGLPPEIATTMLLSLPAGLAVALVNVASRTVLLQTTPRGVHARVFATQMTLANLGALGPTLLAGLLIDIAGVRPVAAVVALSLVLGAVFARRIGGEARRLAPA